ncbi:WW domain-containing oxidoreductase [Tetrabaena socialis]|uniref:WW domain-containing oxidoreductase n=1 Tax=Tetrabaena socialis TaxID=47790 RepID=A0A2J8A1X5_9CHLO|nr:WW domain-containing oxidoreductase [Tetrabaena socialis]|eukprot:PNH06526.1 WW domain-containing oxidoreductase [Tetrabaena socialis]
MSLEGKVALVTGATSGIGLETASALAGLGATVILGVRNTSAAEGVVKSIVKKHPGSKVVIGPSLDLMSQDSVRKFAAAINEQYPAIHILINNAGVSFMSKTFTPDGVGGIAQTNHLGPYTLTRLLERKLVASKARVVTVASVTHRTTLMVDARAFLTDWRSGYYQHSKRRR